MSGVRLLAIDSSTQTLSLAACNGHHERLATLPGGAQASAVLLPQALALLQALDLPLASLDAIAFGAGPGAFTGLRSAASVAQGLSFGLGCPLIAVDSLMLMAQAATTLSGCGEPAGPLDVAVAMDARMDEVYAARYRWQPASGWLILEPPGLWAPAALTERWVSLPLGLRAGTGWPLLGEGLPPSASGPVLALPEEARAAALLALARQAWAQGATRPPAEGLPVYVRDKVALTTSERQAQPQTQAGGQTLAGAVPRPFGTPGA